MIGMVPEGFGEEQERIDRLFLQDVMQDVDELYEKNASLEYLQFLKEEDERLAALEAQGIWAG